MAAAVRRRVLAHARLQETWATDLAASELGASFRVGLGDAASLRPKKQPGEQLVGNELDNATHGAEAEVDSDDASDAYSSGEDEDEPLAEMMDELEGAAVDLDDDGDVELAHVEAAAPQTSHGDHAVVGAADEQHVRRRLSGEKCVR